MNCLMDNRHYTGSIVAVVARMAAQEKEDRALPTPSNTSSIGILNLEHAVSAAHQRERILLGDRRIVACCDGILSWGNKVVCGGGGGGRFGASITSPCTPEEPSYLMSMGHLSDPPDAHIPSPQTAHSQANSCTLFPFLTRPLSIIRQSHVFLIVS